MLKPPPLHAAYQALLKRNRITPNSNQLALLNALTNLQTSLTNPTIHTLSRGIYIHGPIGTGKSLLANLFHSTLPPSLPSRRAHFHTFMLDIHSRLHHVRSLLNYSGDPLYQIGRQVSEESKVLVFDEFQVTDIADAMILKRLFGGFWGGGGVIVANSNRKPEGLYERGLNRGLFLPFIKELRERCEVWGLEGSDYRMRMRGERKDVFFLEKEGFEGSFRRELGRESLTEVVIPVLMSRELRVLGAEQEEGKLVVYSSFEDLCQNFLGSADYYALCEVASTIYLPGIRKFKADELDFVRRFITLVDLAYEAKIRIICLSDVPLLEVFSNIVPRDLRVEGQLKQDLKEMTVKGEGGSSSSMMSTFVGELEWSATGLAKASLASGGAGETDVGFAVGRAVSRLYEMGSESYGT